MLSYSVKGSGPAWVFLHGFLESSSMWESLPLDDSPIQQIRIDLPGHGNSALPDQAPSLAGMAQAVFEVLDSLAIQSFSVVGHSMGAYVGLELSKQPGFQQLILLNSNCWSDSEQKKQDRLRVAQIVHKAKDIFIREAIPNLFQSPESSKKEIAALIEEAKLMTPEAIAFSALAMRERQDITSHVNAFPEKFIFIHGIHDRLVSVEELNTKVPFSEKHYLNCGHMAHIEAKEEVMEILNMKINASNISELKRKG
jgi:pimeloyl-ACP methyl ester carboxylesterase